MPNPDGKGGWQPGQSGNPKGRPRKEESLTDLLRDEALLEDVKDGEGYVTRKQALSKKLWSMALGGDMCAIRYVYDRIDGKPEQYQNHDLEMSGADELIRILQEANGSPDDEPDR